MHGHQQWECDVCTFKQSAHAVRCAMCQNTNPFKIGSSQSASYFQPQRAPPKPKPVVKNELKYQAKPRANGEFGKIIYQTDRISKQQVLDTYAIYLLNKDRSSSSWPLYVFGENDIDKARPKGGERDMIGGLAGVLGDYDTSVSFGITTTFYRNKHVNKDFAAFKKIVDADFELLLKFIRSGHDIIVPSPNMQDLHGFYEKSYWKTVNNEKKQVIFHNIGTGLACIPFQYIEYIQHKFDILKQIGDTNSDKQGQGQEAKDNNESNDKSEPPPLDNNNNKNKKVESDKDNKDKNKNKNSNIGIDADAALAKAIHLSMQDAK